MIDDSRQHLRDAIGRLLARNAELLRDLSELPLPQHLLKYAWVDWKVRAGTDPRLRLLTISRLLQLREDPLQSAILLQQLQRHQQQRTLRLHVGGPRRTARRGAELPAHRTACIAAKYAAQDRIEKAHGRSLFTCKGRSLRWKVEVRAAREAQVGDVVREKHSPRPFDEDP